MTSKPQALDDKTSPCCIRGVDYRLRDDGNCIWITGTNGASVRVRMHEGKLELYYGQANRADYATTLVP